MAKLKFHDLTISAVRSDTASSVELSFDIPAALADDFVFEPGHGRWAGPAPVLFDLLATGRAAALCRDQTD